MLLRQLLIELDDPSFIIFVLDKGQFRAQNMNLAKIGSTCAYGCF